MNVHIGIFTGAWTGGLWYGGQEKKSSHGVTSIVLQMLKRKKENFQLKQVWEIVIVFFINMNTSCNVITDINYLYAYLMSLYESIIIFVCINSKIAIMK